MNELFQHKRVQGGVLFVIIALAAYLFVITVNEIKEFRYIGAGIPATNTITVQGEGEIFAVPDIGTFTFSVQAEDGVASVAQNDAAERANAIIAYLKENDVEEKDIKTTNYNFYPRYEYRENRAIFPPQGDRVFIGFEVNQTIEVKVRDTGKAGELLAGVGAREATSVSGLSFTIDDEETVRAEAREKAIADAKEKAKKLSRDLGVRLMRVVSFSEGFRGIPYAEERAFGVGGDMAVSSAPQLPTGENRIISNVSVTYEIR
ncbi:MAG: SIMPL domain-containing protein [Candidatus Paceibacterota bacterium]